MYKFDFYEVVIVVRADFGWRYHLGKRAFIIGRVDPHDGRYGIIIEGEGEVFDYPEEALQGTGMRINKECYESDKFVSEIFEPSIFDECAEYIRPNS